MSKKVPWRFMSGRAFAGETVSLLLADIQGVAVITCVTGQLALWTSNDAIFFLLNDFVTLGYVIETPPADVQTSIVWNNLEIVCFGGDTIAIEAGTVGDVIYSVSGYYYTP